MDQLRQQNAQKISLNRILGELNTLSELEKRKKKIVLLNI